MGKIFISYRREEDEFYAHTLYRELLETFDKEDVFMDVDNIPIGHDFVKVLNDALAQSDIMLVVIGRRWLKTKRGGKRRINDPEDFVRMEIEAALQRNIHVIPVIQREGTLPAPEDLPESLKPLARRQAAIVSPANSSEDIVVLVEAVKSLL
ncbi:MAG: toll/interleukin-1 receptor domain-containing protein, partial [Pseudomonadota bacterium]